MGKKMFRLFIFGGVVLFSFCLSVEAQTAPDAAQSGVVERDLLEKSRIQLPDFERQQDVIRGFEDAIGAVESAEESKIQADDQRILVKSFVFEGNQVLSESWLQTLTARYSNTEMTFEEIRSMTRKITEAYRRKGYFLARAYLPVQDIVDGQIRIIIAEGRLGEVTVEGAQYYREDFILSHFRPDVKGVLHYHRFLRALLILNEYPGLDVRAVVRRGKEPNTADLVLKVEDHNPAKFGFDANNYGSRYVSRSRYGVYFNLSNLIQSGDSLAVRGMTGSPIHSLGFGGLDYALPVNSYGTRAILSWSWSDFDVQREFRAIDSAGGSRVAGLSLQHPVQRTRRSSLDIFSGVELKESDNYLLGATSSTDDIILMRTGFKGSYTDFVRGRNHYSMVLNLGDNRSDTAPSRVGSSGNFMSGQIEIGRFQEFLFDTYLYAHSNIQLTGDDLPVSEQLAIGGAGTVRGYPQAEYLGDYGFAASLEWMIPPLFLDQQKMPFLDKEWTDFLQFVTFVDHGQVYLKNPQPGESENEDISSAGFGVRLDFGGGLFVKFDVGFPFAGSESSDGSNSAGHFFIQKEFKFF